MTTLRDILNDFAEDIREDIGHFIKKDEFETIKNDRIEEYLGYIKNSLIGENK